MTDLLQEETSQATATTSETVNVDTSNSVGTGSTPQTSTNWLDSIPESFRNEGFVNRHNDMDSFLNSMKHAQSMIGRKNGIPDFENDAPEVIASFREQLGVPKDADGYKIDLPEGFEANEDFASFKEIALKGNVPNDIANQFFQMNQQSVRNAIQQVEALKDAEINAAFDELKSDPNFGDISNNARNILKQIDPTGELLNEGDLAELGVKAPQVARFLDKAAKMIMDDSVPKAMSTTSHGSYEEAYNSIRADVSAGRISAETGNQRIADLTARYNS